jgi:hypothetical protein
VFPEGDDMGRREGRLVEHMRGSEFAMTIEENHCLRAEYLKGQDK